ncbi:hypothetical protein ACOMHN_025123 [Nucella lapillus]
MVFVLTFCLCSIFDNFRFLYAFDERKEEAATCFRKTQNNRKLNWVCNTTEVTGKKPLCHFAPAIQGKLLLYSRLAPLPWPEREMDKQSSAGEGQTEKRARDPFSVSTRQHGGEY